MRIQVIEPHGDDAFISCSSALKNQNLDIDIITFSDRSSDVLKDFYSPVKSTKFLNIPDIHYDHHLKFNTHEIHRRYKEGEDLYNNYTVDMDRLLASLDDTERFKEGFYLTLIPDDSLLSILPLGLFHPNHYATRKIIEDRIPESDARIYYVDKPYIEKRYMKEILSTSSFIFYTAPVQSKDTRAKIFKEAYPTEQSLLRFSSQSILEWKDIYAIRSQDIDHPLVQQFLKYVSDMEKGDKFENLIYHAHQD